MEYEKTKDQAEELSGTAEKLDKYVCTCDTCPTCTVHLVVKEKHSGLWFCMLLTFLSNRLNMLKVCAAQQVVFNKPKTVHNFNFLLLQNKTFVLTL